MYTSSDRNRAQGGTMKENTEDEIETARVYKRFYAALQASHLAYFVFKDVLLSTTYKLLRLIPSLSFETFATKCPFTQLLATTNFLVELYNRFPKPAMVSQTG